ncbi:hypothetical protein [Rhizobium sp. EC-SD404]|uniref:hypothetical protein n=1 Tax=Rhizobium sp. EC-SD404 TaxID=2038389 RepID=UPI00125B5AD6|nr:hypothetical protein [Rhizobium sp. EC-SD404]VVT32874.1 hypothetical protein RHIZ404_230647 [Rhizobium sp. EC-SD404]
MHTRTDDFDSVVAEFRRTVAAHRATADAEDAALTEVNSLIGEPWTQTTSDHWHALGQRTKLRTVEHAHEVFGPQIEGQRRILANMPEGCDALMGGHSAQLARLERVRDEVIAYLNQHEQVRRASGLYEAREAYTAAGNAAFEARRALLAFQCSTIEQVGIKARAIAEAIASDDICPLDEDEAGLLLSSMTGATLAVEA